MLDFLEIEEKYKNKQIEISPSFTLMNKKGSKPEDIMIRGRDFYAVYDEENKLWSTDEYTLIKLVDKELKKYYDDNIDKFYGSQVYVNYLRNGDSKSIDKFHHYVQHQIRDQFHDLNLKIISADKETKRNDYCTRKLNYNIQKGDISAYDKLMSTIFEPDERRKLEWAIGSVISGDSKRIQKFIVLYGGPGTGKSTFLNIVQDMFDGYCSTFEAKKLADKNDQFSMSSFKNNPLISIQQDGDLSKIQDNTKLNSIVSHEKMIINEKHKAPYEMKIKSFLFMGTNEPVDITSSKSGIIRRLIDVRPSGNIIDDPEEFDRIRNEITYEYGAIAYHCLSVYNKLGMNYYKYYEARDMREETDDMYNFIVDYCIDFLLEKDMITCKDAWEKYNDYCVEYGILYKLQYKKFKSELKEYFLDYKDRLHLNNEYYRNVYIGLNKTKIGMINKKVEINENNHWLKFDSNKSIFDKTCSECKAQYATKTTGTPKKKWENVDTVLSDIDTSELHYVIPPDNHIVIDFDIKGDNGEKNLELNISEAMKFPETYAELSKSGNGIHLHYIYDGDIDRLSRLYDNNIEIKIFKGNSSLRRKVTKCNNIPIKHISSGLPLKKEKPMAINKDVYKNEKSIRNMVLKNLNKEIHPNTKPSIDFIKKILDDAYESGIKYDLSDMRPAVISFALNSTHQSENCISIVNKMHFKSDHSDDDEYVESEKDDIVFFDVEVFPNLFVVCYKFKGTDDDSVISLVNPDSETIKQLFKYKLIGFNNKRYDNHILYAKSMGYNNMGLFTLSQRIINGSRNALFGNAYNLSYSDIYDFASAGRKKSLKKFQIELGLDHIENSYKWDEPVPEDKWDEIVSYCCNDVITTEKVFDHLEEDWDTRLILSDIAEMSPNTSTNSLTTKIIFGNDKNPKLNYVDLSEEFPGYEFKNGKSYYMDEEINEGGYVYAEPGYYVSIPLLDIESMHPHTIIALNYLGKYTKNFEELVNLRLGIKHDDYSLLSTVFNGKLKKYVGDVDKCKKLSTALKTPINSVYGLTFAKFDNPFKHPRNVDNIIAKRGALFMCKLKHEVQKRGYTVAHIKTDSIKIPNADDDIIKFVSDLGKQYGYNFDYEALYDRMCLVNQSVYIAKYADNDINGDKSNKWTATGTQFKIPYVFKTLFSHEPIKFKDLCEIKQVQSSMYLDFSEGLPDVTLYEKIKEYRNKKPDKLTKKELSILEEYKNLNDDELDLEISKGHNYIFIGKVGSFCPVKDGCDGGYLVREQNGKYYAVVGTTGYKWKESKIIQELNLENEIDHDYYASLIDDAVETINKYVDIECLTD